MAEIRFFSSRGVDMGPRGVRAPAAAARRDVVWPGQGKRLHISFPDPARAEGDDAAKVTVFRNVRDDIERRVLSALDD